MAPNPYLPVPYTPGGLDPIQQLAQMAGGATGVLGAGPQQPLQATYVRPIQMPNLQPPQSWGQGQWVSPPGTGAGPMGPSTTPVSIRRPNIPGTGAGASAPNFNIAGNPGAVLASQAAGAAGEGNMLSRLLGKAGSAKFPGGRLGIGAAAVGIPLIASQLAPRLGGQETFLGRLVAGAGAGAGVGALGGPWGAAIGGAVGGVGNVLFGGGEEGPDFEEQLDSILDQGQFSAEDAGEIRLMYSVLKETQGEEVAKTTIGELIVADIQMRDQQQLAAEDAQSRMLATQALTAQFFQPFTQQLLDSAQQRYAITESLANNLPPQYRDIARAQNAASLDNSTRVANAYAAQAQLLPAFAAIEQQQGIASQLAQQQAQNVMMNLGYIGGGGGGGSLVDMLSEQLGQ